MVIKNRQIMSKTNKIVRLTVKKIQRIYFSIIGSFVRKTRIKWVKIVYEPNLELLYGSNTTIFRPKDAFFCLFYYRSFFLDELK